MIKIKIKKKSINENIDKTSSLAILDTNGEYILFDAEKLVSYFASLQSLDDLGYEKMIENNIAIAYLKIDNSAEVSARYGSKCMDASEVVLAGLNPNMKGSRLGSFLLAAVGNIHPEGLMGDRSSISASARLAMQRLAAMANIKTIQDPETGEVLSGLDDKDSPKTKSTKDDCKIYHGDAEDFLNNVYLIKSSEINTQALLNNAPEAFKKASEITKGLLTPIDIEMLISEAGPHIYRLRITDVT